MVILWVSRQVRRLLALVKNLADQDTVDSDSTLAPEIHYARVGVTFLEEQVLVEFVYEVYFHGLHSLFDTFKN